MKKRKAKELPHKPFWAILGILFLLSFLVMLSSLDQTLLTGNAAVQNIAFGKGGAKLVYEVKEILGVKDMTITLKENVKQAQIVLTPDESIAFMRTAYSKFTLISNQEKSIAQIDFTLKIPERDLLKVKIHPQDLKMYVNENKAVTTFVKTEKEYHYYTASTTAFGKVVLGKKEIETPAVSTVPKTFEAPQVQEPLPVEPPAAVESSEQIAESVTTFRPSLAEESGVSANRYLQFAFLAGSLILLLGAVIFFIKKIKK